MFTSTRNKGFQMTFQNGMTISVQFGTDNYCERRNFTTSYRGDMDAATPIITSSDAEIAIWDKDDHWFNFGNDTVKGWCNTDEVTTWIGIAREARTINDITDMAIHFGMMNVI